MGMIRNGISLPLQKQSSKHVMYFSIGTLILSIGWLSSIITDPCLLPCIILTQSDDPVIIVLEEWI